MNNLIRGTVYQLKKDNFFFGCLGLGAVFLIVSIRSFSQGLTDPTVGLQSLMTTFLGGDPLLSMPSCCSRRIWSRKRTAPAR